MYFNDISRSQSFDTIKISWMTKFRRWVFFILRFGKEQDFEAESNTEEKPLLRAGSATSRGLAVLTGVDDKGGKEDCSRLEYLCSCRREGLLTFTLSGGG